MASFIRIGPGIEEGERSSCGAPMAVIPGGLPFFFRKGRVYYRARRAPPLGGAPLLLVRATSISPMQILCFSTAARQSGATTVHPQHLSVVYWGIAI